MLPGWHGVLAEYESPQDVDLYAGLLMEQHMAGAQVGPTAGCIIADQFIALKKGDRFWHENAGVYSNEQLAEVKEIGLAKVMCSTLEGMKKASERPFLKANTRVNGNMNGVHSCQKIGQISFKAWNTRSTSTGGATPKPPVEGGDDKPTTTAKPIVEHTTIGCKLVNGRRNGIVQCGRAGNWDDVSMAALADHLETKNGMPIVGKKQTIVALGLKKVRRLDISGNANIKNVAMLKKVISHFPNLLELNISNTGVFGVSKETIDQNPLLGNIGMTGTQAACMDLDLYLQLSKNLAAGNKFIFFS